MRYGSSFCPSPIFQGAMIPNWLMIRPELSPGAKLCFAQLMQSGDLETRDTGTVRPNDRFLSELLGASEADVKGWLEELESWRLLGRDDAGNHTFLWHEWIGANE